MVYESADQIDFEATERPFLPDRKHILLVDPEHFQVVYVINPHMDGNIGSVDVMRARQQWEALADTYRRLGYTVGVLPGVEGLPDMVFSANQSLPIPPDASGRSGVVLSRMHSPYRRAEVQAFADYFIASDHRVLELPEHVQRPFEGTGDALWHSNRKLLWGGYGFRTDRKVYDFLSELLDTPVALLRLEDPDFYHLDTCLTTLGDDCALIYPGAFDAAGQALLQRLFARLIEAPEDESRERFACNAHCPDGKHVIIQRGCTVTNARLRAEGFEPVEVDTDEFIKSGGSVYCMKLHHW